VRLGPLVLCSLLLACVAGMASCGGATVAQEPAPPPPSPPPPAVLQSIAVTPGAATLIVGNTAQLMAIGSYSDGSQQDITGMVAWACSNANIATVSSTGLVSGAGSGQATITATSGSLTGSATLTVSVNVTTWHYDDARTGLNPAETVLNPQTVNSANFGKLFSYILDGYPYAQPLYVANVTINGAAHNVVLVATEHDSVYAFDADSYGNGSPLWQISLLGAGETPLTSGSIKPYEGVTSTPVVDASSNTMYVLSTQISGTNGFFRLHALDITNGTEKFGGPVVINASVPGTNSDSINGILYLTTSCVQRSALLLVNNTIILGFGGCHSGWLVSYDAQTLTQTGVFNMSPNADGYGTFGGAGGVWMGGGGPAADSSGNVYISTGNGPYDGNTAFGDSILKFDTNLHLLDHFTPSDWSFLWCNDSDIGAGGVSLIGGGSQLVAGGKQGRIYLLNTGNLGGLQANDAGAAQELWFESDIASPYPASCTDNQGMVWTSQLNSYEIFGTAASFNGSVYLGITPTTSMIPGPVRQFSYLNGQLSPGSVAPDSILPGSYGTTPILSAGGNSGGIVWIIDHGEPVQTATPTNATLRAYDASNLAIELYNSSQVATDTPGLGIKFTSPIVANGKVYMGTGHDPTSVPNPTGELDVYGLRSSTQGKAQLGLKGASN
jgi:Big-like domain-containing protein